MRICVLSDIHYKYSPDKSSDRENALLILSFLKESVGRYDLMVLNGDIFDLWYDWKYVLIKQYFPFLHLLANLRDAGCKLVHISGNHDFWFNDFLPEYLGMELYDERYILKADGKRMMFTHGDLHTVNDMRYKLFRRVIRQGWVKWIFASLHPDLALTIGKKMSRSSRLRRVSTILQNKKSSGLTHYATGQIKNKGFDIIAMGHSHSPSLTKIGQGCYVNSGDWMRAHSYVEINDGNVELKYYKHKETKE
ncbi:MAG: UDP-2,3-diacylglucosamine diphosphatase [Candidatus Cloacimonadaceae bacterium]|nr:UDP-2,3-diacylglucosamine diphosphatase [Candidatus Cloacimonadaceae bacterium]